MTIYTHTSQFYLFNLERDSEVDAFQYGNKLRYINHGFDQLTNATVEMKFVDGRYRITLYAYQDIKAGQEILFDYGHDFRIDWKVNFNQEVEKWQKS